MGTLSDAMPPLTPEKILALLRERWPFPLPTLDVADVLTIEVIERRNGAYAEAYLGKPCDGSAGPGVAVFMLERTGEIWALVTGSSHSAKSTSGADMAAAVDRARVEQAHYRPKPVRVVKTKLVAAKPAMGESAGAGELERTNLVGEARCASDVELAGAEHALGTRFPAGYRTFVTKLGHGTYGTRVRVALPADVVTQLSEWRGRIEQYWFWGDAPLPQSRALEGVRVADTIDGDELVFHPDDPDAIWLLPRHGSRARMLGRGLAAALGKLVRAKSPELVAHGR